MTSPPVLQLDRIQMDYQLGQVTVKALKGVDVLIHEGEFVALSGASGSGKTTLLNIMGALERPTAGHVFVDKEDLRNLNESSLADLRAKKIGFIFQTFNLIPVLTALENVEYGLLNLAFSPGERTRMSEHALGRVGLRNFVDHRPNQLSGGQRQRVAIARALVKKPRLLLADEPTANLDSKTAAGVLDLMAELNRQEGLTVVIASHDPLVLQRASKVIKISDGLKVE